MKHEARKLLHRLEEGDVIRECDFAIYGQIGYKEPQLNPSKALERGLSERFLGKPWRQGFPEFFRILGSDARPRDLKLWHVHNDRWSICVYAFTERRARYIAASACEDGHDEMPTLRAREINIEAVKEGIA